MGKTLQNETYAYKLVFNETLGEEMARIIAERLINPSRSRTRVCLHTIQAQTMLKQEDLFSYVDADHYGGGVLVVENVDLTWMATLGVAFKINPTFFAEHAANPQGSFPWAAVFGKWSADHRKPINRHLKPQPSNGLPTVERESWHVDGVIEYETPQQQQSSLVEANLLPRLIAYDRQNDLMLVDAPVIRFSTRSCSSSIEQRSQLRVPLGLNRGGLVLPYLLDEAVPSIFGCLYRFFSHPWHFHVLFAKNPTTEIHLSPETIFHLIAASTWGANLRVLEQRIKSFGLDEIRRPSIRTIDMLHDQRRDLTFTLEQVAKASKWMPPHVRSELEAVKDKLPAAKYIGYPDLVQNEILESAIQLEKFLMDTFSLLLSTIIVLEAESTRKHAGRSQMLTNLAFVYVPLSFVTSIFGMNVKEINGSPVSIWVTIIIFIVIGCCTGAVLTSSKMWRIARRAW